MSGAGRDDQADARALRDAAEVLEARAPKQTFMVCVLVDFLRRRADRIARPA